MFLKSFFSSWALSMTEFPVIGLDISDLSVKFIRFDNGRDSIAVRYAGNAELNPGIVVNGNIEKPSELTEVLSRLATDGGNKIKDKFAVASLPEEKGFIQTLRLVKVKAENLDAAVRWELESAVPLPVDEIYFDYEAVPSASHSDHLDVLMLAYPRGVVDAYASVLSGAGFIPMALELESQAVVRALVGRADPKPMLVIDIGATRTSFVLVANGGIIHTSTMAISGQSFEDDISKGLGVPREKARELKVEVGLSVKKEGGMVARALAESLQFLIEEILRHIEFYRNHMKDRGEASESIEKIILTGGDSNLVGIESYLARGVKVMVERGNPFGPVLPKMGERTPPIPAHVAHAYTTAIGLALRQIV